MTSTPDLAAALAIEVAKEIGLFYDTTSDYKSITPIFEGKKITKYFHKIGKKYFLVVIDYKNPFGNGDLNRPFIEITDLITRKKYAVISGNIVTK